MQQGWALRRKRVRRWIMLVNTPGRFARRFGFDPPVVEQVASSYRKALKGASKLGNLRRGQFSRKRTLEVLWRRADYRGAAALLVDGDRKRLNAEEGAAYRGAVLDSRRQARGAAVKDTMHTARELGISALVPNYLDVLRSRPVVCRLCGRVFLRPRKITAQRYCPACKQRYSPKQRWSRKLDPRP